MQTKKEASRQASVRRQIDRHGAELASCIARAHTDEAARARVSELQTQLGELIATTL